MTHGAPFYSQSGFAVRFDWGEAGLRALAPFVSTIVIVDVLSFSTAVDVAVSRGATVYPAPWKDERAHQLARDVNAELAVPREQVTKESPWSLSPPTLLDLVRGARLVLPSPNGATLTAIAAESSATVLVGCLRNATAVGRACRRSGGNVAVIAAGERWSVDEGALRPAIEDLLGAGAILHAIGGERVSPEARAAIAAFEAARDRLPDLLRDCASGRELIDAGYPDDVAIASRLDSSTALPVLRDGALINAASDRDERIDFRPLVRDDFGQMLVWLSDPDVAAWYQEGALTLENMEVKYGPVIDGREPTRSFIVLIDDRPAGYIQAYYLGDYPEYLAQVELAPDVVSTDILLGDPAYRNNGWGAPVLRAFHERIVFGAMGANTASIIPDARNARAIAAYRKAGFTPTRIVTIKDLETGEIGDELIMLMSR